MAEKGAHLTASVLARPSIFELLAQDSLARTIHRAVRKLCEVLALANPGKFGFTVRWFDELYLLGDILLQWRYLHSRGGSFSEAFYSLQRIVDFSSGVELPKSKLQLSLICLTVLPYLRRKFENLVVKWKLEEADSIPENKKYPKGTRTVVIRVHSIFHIVWESLVMIQYFAYMSGNSTHHSPILRTIGVSLIYISQEFEGLPWSALKTCIAARDFRCWMRAITKIFVLSACKQERYQLFCLFLGISFVIAVLLNMSKKVIYAP